MYSADVSLGNCGVLGIMFSGTRAVLARKIVLEAGCVLFQWCLWRCITRLNSRGLKFTAGSWAFDWKSGC